LLKRFPNNRQGAVLSYKAASAEQADCQAKLPKVAARCVCSGIWTAGENVLCTCAVFKRKVCAVNWLEALSGPWAKQSPEAAGLRGIVLADDTGLRPV